MNLNPNRKVTYGGTTNDSGNQSLSLLIKQVNTSNKAKLRLLLFKNNLFK